MQSCAARWNDNIKRVPAFLCMLNASISIEDSCAIHIQERLVVPWSANGDRRCVKHQPGQRVTRPVAFQFMPNGTMKEMDSVAKKYDRRTTCINFAPALIANESQIYIFDYSLTEGIMRYRKCDGKGEIHDNVTEVYPKVKPEQLFMTKWRPDSITPAIARHIHIEFNVKGLTRERFYGGYYYPDSTFKATVSTVATKNIFKVLFHGEGKEDERVRSNFVVIYETPETLLASCRHRRTCRSEAASTGDYQSTIASNRQARLFGSVATIVVGFIIAIVLIYTHRRARSYYDANESSYC